MCFAGNLTVGVLFHWQADMVACVSSRSLDLASGGATGALLKMGGISIQTDCDNQLKTKFPEGLKMGKYVIVRAGKLKYKRLYLSLLPKYSDDKWSAEKVSNNYSQ